MDQDFKTFLSKKGISEDKYNGMSDELQFKWGELFEKSKQGKSPGLTVIQPLCHFLIPSLEFLRLILSVLAFFFSCGLFGGNNR